VFVATRQITPQGLGLLSGSIDEGVDCLAADGPRLRPELVAEITYLSWPDDGLPRHTVFVGLREDKPAREVRREAPK
jgi:ATP-dependent DNA ligase